MKKGFTLLELLIVVTIIAALTIIAIPQYTFTVEKSRATQMLKATRDIFESAERYAVRNDITVTSRFTNLDISLTGPLKGTLSSSSTSLTTDTAKYTLSTAYVTAERTSSFGTYSVRVNRSANSDLYGQFECVYAGENKDLDRLCRSMTKNEPTGTTTKVYKL